MNELPRGWARTTIEDVADYVQRGKSPMYVDRSDLPVINQKAIRWDGIEEQNLKFVDPAQWDSWEPARFVRTNDVLWNSTGTGTIGRATLFTGLQISTRAVVDSHVTIVRPTAAISGKYLCYFIRSEAVQSKIASMQTGSTNQVELNKSEVLATEIILPPLPEQCRIVSKVDALTARSKRAREDLDRVPHLIRRYKQVTIDAAYHASAVAGSLMPLGELTHEIRNGLSRKPNNLPPGTPILRISAVRPGRVWLGDVRYYVPQPGEAVRKYLLDYGDVLFTRYNGNADLVAACGVVRPPIGECLYPDKLIRVRTNKAVLVPEFLELIAQASESRQILRQYIKTAAGQYGISGGDLRRLPVPTPPVEEQIYIVRCVERAFAWIDRLAAEAASARHLVDKLDQAILAKAFRGELVAQDPNDEPADALLARIQAERAAGPKTRSVRGRGRSKRSGGARG